MPDQAESFAQGQGRLTHGPQANALVERTLEFVRDQLPGWRDRKDRKYETDEERLNAQLCKHLNARSRQVPLPVLFHHEEKQIGHRRVDISAGPAEGGFVGTTYHSIDDPFLVLEGKRLPPPGGKAREREYVTGQEKRTGGIQRFKLGLHGEKVATAVLIGYLQKDSPTVWHQRINGWIRDLENALPLGEELWTHGEQLQTLAQAKATRMSSCESRHGRASRADSPEIRILHFWIEMTQS